MPSAPPKDIPPIQSTYVELGGSAGIYSLNYDAVFSNGIGFRVGGTYLPESIERNQFSESRYKGTTLLVVLLMGEYLVGKGPHKFETSAGVMFGESNPQSTDVPIPDIPGIPFSFGYRYLPEEVGKITVKAAFTPTIYGGRLHPRVGFSIGLIIGQN